MPLGLFGTQDFTGIAPEFHRNQFIVTGKKFPRSKHDLLELRPL
jgi:hypothetical protein